MNAADDARARSRALDPAHSFIVQAPAGSGKTELLTQRFLRLLATVDEPEEILAITFTRKAAAEMRERILNALHKAREPRPEAEWAQRTWELARAALDRDEAREWRLTDHPNRLRVQTFDSLASALAGQLPVLSRLGAPPRAREDAKALYREAARQLLGRLDDADIGPALQSVLRHLHNRLGHLEDLLVDLLERRDQWLPHLRADHEDMAEVLREQVEHQIRQAAARLPDALLARLLPLARHAATRLASDKLRWLPRWAERDGAPGTTWEDLPDWLGLVELVLTKDMKGPVFRTKLTKDEGFPPKDENKAAMQALLGELAEVPGLDEALHRLRRLPLAPPDAEQRALLDALRALLQQAAAELLLVFRAHGELDFIEIQQRALRALGSDEAPGEAALRLDHRLRHLLVDEFQDTSSGQYQLLLRLTAGWLPDDGRTLFLVGDPMQSIYRFRKAEVGLFLQTFEGRLGEVTLEALTLSRNFRSQAGLVDWCNATFGALFPVHRDAALGAMPHSPSVPVHPAAEGEAVSIHAFDRDDPALEAERVCELVRQRLAERDDGTIAILGRARRHLSAIAQTLKAAGIPYQALKVAPLAEQPTVRDLHALLRALLHPADRLSWLALLRSPLVGLDPADLAALAEGETRPLPVLLADPDVTARLSEDGRRRAARLHTLLAGELPARHRRPLREWLEGCWLALGGAVVGNHEDAAAYLDLVERQAGADGIDDLAALEQALDQLYAPPDPRPEAKRVLLTTLHQSKGLQFDTVILPGLGRKAASDGKQLLYWQELARPNGGTGLLIAPFPRDKGSDPLVDFLKDLEKQKAAHEVLRLLYVAATRAEQRLHLLGHVRFSTGKKTPRAPYPAKNSLLEALWPVVGEHFGDLQPPDSESDDRPAPRPPAERRTAADWRLTPPPGLATPVAPPPEGQAIEYQWAGDVARHVGTLVHRWLERIARDGLARWSPERLDGLRPRLRTALAALGIAPDALDEAVDKARRALERTLQDPRGRWILDDHEQAACEWPLTVLDEQGEPRQYIIDRTFVEDGTRWIIDYKTGDHQGGDLEGFLDNEQERYRDQLENYARILRLREDRPIRLALYFPLLGAWREWTPED